MKFGVPWSVKGIQPEARETEGEAVRQAGMSLDDWLNPVTLPQAAENGAQAPAHNYDDDKLANVHQRLDQFVNNSSSLAAAPMPSAPLSPALDRAVAEITARQRVLNNQPGTTRQMPPTRMPSPSMTPAALASPASVLTPAPMQDISGLKDQLRRITDQIETLRKPGIEEAINALRAEVGDIGRALNDAVPRRAIEAIEKQIAGLTQRIAEGRQAGIGDIALTGIERGLAEVRDAVRSLTPAENLVGFNNAVAGLAHKIDLVVSQKDPTTLKQLEHSINALREMTAHVASEDAVAHLANQVQTLSDKVNHLAATGGTASALNNLEHRIAALADALERRAQSSGDVPPMLDAQMHSLSHKIDLIQQSRGDNLALGHLEDRIVKLMERLDASDSRLGHLEAIERGLADLLVHVENMHANKEAGGPRAESEPSVDALKNNIARTQDALEQVHGTLGHVVDRLASIEKDIRSARRSRPVSDEEFAEIQQPVGNVAVRRVTDYRPAPPKQPPSVSVLPNHPNLSPDEPLEPGFGPPPLRAGARIAADATSAVYSRASGGAGKSSFIAAARRAAQAAAQATPARMPVTEPTVDSEDRDAPSLGAKMAKRVKSLFIAASIIAVAVGSVQIAGNYFNFGSPADIKTAEALDPIASENEPADADEPQDIASTPAVNPIELPKQAVAAPLIVAPLALPSANPTASVTPLSTLTAPTLAVAATPSAAPPLLSPPLLNAPHYGKTDITGSVGPNAPPVPPPLATAGDQLPIAIGGTRLRNAAMAGDPAAAFEIAVRFAEGRGVPVDLEEAARWYERAANRGLAPAQFRYASLLEKGQGVRKNLAQARRLYLAAAAKGNGKAMHNLAVLYAEGIDGKPDYTTAVLWFRKAAQHGIADSQYNLAVLCARGFGTTKSYDESYKWFALAAAQGDREAGKKRDEVANHLIPEALAAAQQAVKAFAPEPQPDEATVVAEPAGGWDRASTTPAAHPKPRLAPPMSLGALEVGER